jgi:hypothetical protein
MSRRKISACQISMEELAVAAYSGTLDRVPGGVTGETLAAARLDGISILCLVIAQGHIGQIEGGVTAQQLAGAKDMINTALHEAAMHGLLDRVKGGVTASQLAAARTDTGWSALHTAAQFNHLDQIRGGVTTQQLVSTKDHQGCSAFAGIHAGSTDAKASLGRAVERGAANTVLALAWRSVPLAGVDREKLAALALREPVLTEMLL